ncbi:MAG: hypothetical protein RLY78_2493, partial [Pseudomonadota bacterium]
MNRPRAPAKAARAVVPAAAPTAAADAAQLYAQVRDVLAQAR